MRDYNNGALTEKEMTERQKQVNALLNGCYGEIVEAVTAIIEKKVNRELAGLSPPIHLHMESISFSSDSAKIQGSKVKAVGCQCCTNGTQCCGGGNCCPPRNEA